jgi:hypothetical protein
MAGQDLFDQRGAGTRHTNDEYRSLVGQTEIPAPSEIIGIEGIDQAVDVGRMRLRIEAWTTGLEPVAIPEVIECPLGVGAPIMQMAQCKVHPGAHLVRQHVIPGQCFEPRDVIRAGLEVTIGRQVVMRLGQVGAQRYGA